MTTDSRLGSVTGGAGLAASAGAGMERLGNATEGAGTVGIGSEFSAGTGADFVTVRGVDRRIGGATNPSGAVTSEGNARSTDSETDGAL